MPNFLCECDGDFLSHKQVDCVCTDVILVLVLGVLGVGIRGVYFSLDWFVVLSAWALPI